MPVATCGWSNSPLTKITRRIRSTLRSSVASVISPAFTAVNTLSAVSQPAPLPCASESAYRPCPECADAEICGTRIIMRQVRDAVSGVLDRTTLADLLQQVDVCRRQRGDSEPPMYYI